MKNRGFIEITAVVFFLAFFGVLWILTHSIEFVIALVVTAAAVNKLLDL